MALPDVIIVGAGVIGCAIADALARATPLRIVVVDRGTPGCEASNAAAGVLAVGSGQARRGMLLELRRRSAAMFPALVAVLEEETGLDLGYRRDGLLSLAFSEPQAAALQDLVHARTQQGLRCQMLTGAEARALEPAISSAVCAGALFPDDRAVNNERLVSALAIAARRRGVEFRLQTAARSLTAGVEGVRVELTGGALEAAVAVVAAGAWSGDLLAPCGIKVPMRPARGEMIAVRSVGCNLRHTLSTGDGYLVPRDDGTILVGSTLAFTGFDKRVTPAGIADLMARGAGALPALRGAPLLRAWAGLRPCPTIRRPIIAPLPGHERVILATGHHRNGILLAPITAQLVAEIIRGAPASVALRPLNFRRH